MTLQKAIEILTDLSSVIFIDKSPDRRSAVKLGIEALKRCNLLSKYHPGIDWQSLPGETEE